MSKATLIIGYGTRSGNLEEILETQADRLRARGRGDVRIAYYRISSPSIEDALRQMAADGVDEVLAMPYYIAEGTLTHELIPQKIGIIGNDGMAEVDGRRIHVRIAPAFGRSRALTGIVFDRVADAGATFDDGVLLVGHGTRDPTSENTRVISMNAERLSKAGFRHVAHAFNDYNEPTVRSAMRILTENGVGRVVVVPMFIADGIHLGHDITAQLGIPAHSAGGTVDVSLYNLKYVPAPGIDDESYVHDDRGCGNGNLRQITGNVQGWSEYSGPRLENAVEIVANWAAKRYGGLDGEIAAVVTVGGEQLRIVADSGGVRREGGIAANGAGRIVFGSTLRTFDGELAHKMYHALENASIGCIIDQDLAAIHQDSKDHKVEIVLTRPVGADPRLVEIMDARIAEFDGE